MSTSSCRSGSAHRVSTIFDGRLSSATRSFQLTKRCWELLEDYGAGIMQLQGVNEPIHDDFAAKERMLAPLLNRQSLRATEALFSFCSALLCVFLLLQSTAASSDVAFGGTPSLYLDHEPKCGEGRGELPRT
jgi:hypothetical protein